MTLHVPTLDMCEENYLNSRKRFKSQDHNMTGHNVLISNNQHSNNKSALNGLPYLTAA